MNEMSWQFVLCDWSGPITSSIRSHIICLSVEQCVLVRFWWLSSVLPISELLIAPCGLGVMWGPVYLALSTPENNLCYYVCLCMHLLIDAVFPLVIQI